MIGFLFYELLDEVYLSGYSDPREAYFGFVTCDAEGHIGEKKPVYHRVQELILSLIHIWDSWNPATVQIDTTYKTEGKASVSQKFMQQPDTSNFIRYVFE